MIRPVAAIALALALAACGNRVDLRPAAGESLPPAPVGRADAPTADELLTRTPQQARNRRAKIAIIVDDIDQIGSKVRHLRSPPEAVPG